MILAIFIYNVKGQTNTNECDILTLWYCNDIQKTLNNIGVKYNISDLCINENGEYITFDKFVTKFNNKYGKNYRLINRGCTKYYIPGGTLKLEYKNNNFRLYNLQSNTEIMQITYNIDDIRYENKNIKTFIYDVIKQLYMMKNNYKITESNIYDFLQQYSTYQDNYYILDTLYNVYFDNYNDNQIIAYNFNSTVVKTPYIIDSKKHEIQFNSFDIYDFNKIYPIIYETLNKSDTITLTFYYTQGYYYESLLYFMMLINNYYNYNIKTCQYDTHFNGNEIKPESKWVSIKDCEYQNSTTTNKCYDVIYFFDGSYKYQKFDSMSFKLNPSKVQFKIIGNTPINNYLRKMLQKVGAFEVIEMKPNSIENYQLNTTFRYIYDTRQIIHNVYTNDISRYIYIDLLASTQKFADKYEYKSKIYNLNRELDNCNDYSDNDYCVGTYYYCYGDNEVKYVILPELCDKSKEIVSQCGDRCIQYQDDDDPRMFCADDNYPDPIPLPDEPEDINDDSSSSEPNPGPNDDSSSSKPNDDSSSSGPNPGPNEDSSSSKPTDDSSSSGPNPGPNDDSSSSKPTDDSSTTSESSNNNCIITNCIKCNDITICDECELNYILSKDKKQCIYVDNSSINISIILFISLCIILL